MANFTILTKADLDKGIKKTYLNTIFATGDALANCFSVQLYKGNASYTIPSSATVKGYFVRCRDNATIELSGTKSGNTVSVTLSSTCYNQNGPFTLTIKVKEGEAETTVFHGEGSMIVSRTGNVVYNGSEAIEYYKYPVNLLDNSDFENAVNQRGSTSLTEHGTYIIDRWKAESANSAATISVSKNGITISPTSTNYGGICQNLENYSQMQGKTFTIAVSIGDTLRAATFVMGAETNGLALGNGLRLYSISGANVLIRNIAGAGAVTIRHVALYEGAYTSETLPQYVPKGYTVELAECLQYYRYFPMIMTGMTAWSFNAPYINFEMPLRKTPNSIKFYSFGTKLEGHFTNANTGEDVIGAQANNSSEYGLRVQSSHGNLVANDIYHFYVEINNDL